MSLPPARSSFLAAFQALLTRYAIPLGLVVLLGGLPLLPDRSLYHKLYYGLVCVPALLLLLPPKRSAALMREPIFLAVLAFIACTWISIGWTTSTEDALSLIKWPLYVLMLFVALFHFQRAQPRRLLTALHVAALLALGSTAYGLAISFPDLTPTYRFIGTGALSNPLLSSHLFGFFAAYWIVRALYAHTTRDTFFYAGAAALMLVAVATTGSRTPLVALALMAIWLKSLQSRKRNAWLLPMAVIVIGGSLLLLAPAGFLQRGFSFRPEIWQQALHLIAQQPWFGHGYDAPLGITVAALGVTFSEPHSFALGVLYSLGLFGLVPWLLMQFFVLKAGWHHRQDWRFVLVSAWMVYGLGAGLAEGGSILSRPKEHWLLLWVPLALMAALSAVERGHRRRIALRPLDAAGLDRLCQGATVIEQDGLGPKVLRLTDGSFLKLFRRKHWLSSASLLPYGQRFARNSLALGERNVTTPDVLETFRLSDGGTAVRYRPLPGQTLRQALQEAQDDGVRRQLIQEAGRFIGQLHETGVYFRSLHLGNVLILPTHQMALIDIADMRLFDKALSFAMRQRNLKHMQRYEQDRRWLFEEQRDALLAGYAQSTSLKTAKSLLAG